MAAVAEAAAAIMITWIAATQALPMVEMDMEMVATPGASLWEVFAKIATLSVTFCSIRHWGACVKVVTRIGGRYCHISNLIAKKKTIKKKTTRN